MNLFLRRVKIHGFLSIGDCDISLDNLGFVKVTGVNKYVADNASSNGSGKSSIFDAILWALTGETIRGATKEICNNKMSDGAYVSLSFSLDGKEYEVLRSRDSDIYKTNLKIFVDGSDLSGKGIRDSEKNLQELLGDLTPNIIRSVIIFGQGLPDRFSNNSPSGRKEVLEKLSKSDYMIEDLKQRVSNRKSEIESSISEIKMNIARLEADRNSREREIFNANEKLKYLGDINVSIDEKNNVEKEIEIVDKKIAELTLKRDETNESLIKTRNEYSNCNTRRNQEIIISTHSIEEKINSIAVEYASLSATARSLSIEISSLKSKSDICPTCGQKLKDVHLVDTSERENNLRALNESLSRLTSEKTNLAKSKESVENDIKHKYEQEIQRLTDVGLSIKNSYNEIVSQINIETNRKNALTGRLFSISQKISQYEYETNRANEAIKSATEAIAKIDEDIAYNNREMINLTNRLDINQKFSTAVSRDFRGYLLSGIIQYIENRAKDYSQSLFGTQNISFEVDGNNIYIGYNDKNYENLSGGEKQKVDIILQLAIRDMLCKYSNFSCNIIALDEITDNLDAKGCNNMMNMITEKLNDISSVFIISHQSDDIPYDGEIVVTKGENGISNVEQ